MYSRNNIFGYSNYRREIKKRNVIIMVVIVLMFSFLMWRSIYNMYIVGPARKAMADTQYRIEEPYGLRYNLIDCKGQDLLTYEVNYFAVIDPVDYLRFNEYTSKYDLEALTFILRNYNKEYDIERIKNNRSSEKVRYKINEETYDKLKDIKEVKGFYTYATNDVVKDKVWKIENLLINAKYYKNLGNSENEVWESVFKSDNSLEMQIYNKTKNNEYEKIRFEKGVNGEISEGKIIKPDNNINVRLTLDKEIQDKVEAILHEEKYKKYDQIGVVLMESSTGKIRAMAQKDDNAYNANLGMPGTNGFYAGSIFKIIVDEAGLDMNLIGNDKEYTVNPKIFPGGHEKFNKYTLSQALAYSSNNIFAQFGSTIGFQNMYRYTEKQGILDKVLNFHHEESGKFEGDNKEVGDISLQAIGLKVRMTPLEALSIPSTIINNGVYVKPSIIDAYVDDNNRILERITSKANRVIKKETAEAVKLHMIDVVNKGTGNLAFIEDMVIGGKTGTSEYYVDEVKHSDGWFVGFFNLHEKNYSMVVFVNNIDVNIEGKIDEEGGTTAAPIFKEVVKAIN